MKKKVGFSFIVSFCLVFFMFILTANAAVLTVDTNDPACGDLNGTPYCTIQAAIDDASPFDEISIMNGYYKEAISILKNNLNIYGESRTGVILDGGHSSYTVTIEANYTNISMMTLMNASAFTVHAVRSNNIHVFSIDAMGAGKFVNITSIGIGGIDFNNIINGSIYDVVSKNHSKNGFSLTASTDISIYDITAIDNGQSPGWAGIALYTLSGFPALSGNTSVTFSGTNIIQNNPMGIYLEDIAPFGINPTNSGSFTFSDWDVAPLVRLGFGDVVDIHGFAVSLGLPFKGSGGLPLLPTLEAYFVNTVDAYNAVLLSLSPLTSLIYDLVSKEYYVGPVMNVSTAIDAALANEAVFVAAGSYDLIQTIITKNISIYGESKETVTLNAVQDTASSGNARGWIFVEAGIQFDMMNLTMDGSGFKIWQAIRNTGMGTIDTVGFQNILFDESGPSYAGTAIAAFGNGNVDILNSMFMNIGRVGVLYFGTGITNSLYDGNIYVGKGEGDFLDYGVEVGAGAVVTIQNSSISANRGVASVDNSSSACILVTTFFGGGSTATILSSELQGCTTGIAVGFDSTDTSTVVANYNSITGNEFGVTSTAPLVDARFNWWGSCDGPSGEGPGNGDSVSTNVTFDPWDGSDGEPIIGYCINKTNPSCVFQDQNVTLKVNLGDSINESAIHLVYYIGGMLFQKPMQLFGLEYRADILQSELLTSEEVIWNVIVETPDGNLTNGNKTFYVANNTHLWIEPMVPDGFGGWYVTKPNFTLHGDMNASMLYYGWEDNVFGYSGKFSLENISNLPQLSAGTLELKYFGGFGETCNESVQSTALYIDLQDPVITVLSPLNGSIVYDNEIINISAHIDDVFQSNSGMNVSTIVMWVDNSTVNFSIFSYNDMIDVNVWIDTLDLGLGEHTVTIMAFDKAGRSSSRTWTFTLEEALPFTMMVNSPLDETLDSRRILVDVDLDTVVEELTVTRNNDRRPRTVRLCRNCDDFESLRSSTKFLREGWNNLTFTAVDQFGSVIEVFREVVVDTRKPKIARTEPRRRAVFNGTGFSVRYTEENLQYVTLYYDGMSQNLSCTSGRNQECSIDVNLSAYDGTPIDYRFAVGDVVHETESRKTSINVDTTPPVLTLMEPQDNGGYGNKVPFELSVSEDTLVEYMVDGSRWRRICSNCDEYGMDRLRTKRFRDGAYSIMFRATDKAGQQDLLEVGISVS